VQLQTPVLGQTPVRRQILALGQTLVRPATKGIKPIHYADTHYHCPSTTGEVLAQGLKGWGFIEPIETHQGKYLLNQNR
jgi:hypothetical protein